MRKTILVFAGCAIASLAFVWGCVLLAWCANLAFVVFLFPGFFVARMLVINRGVSFHRPSMLLALGVDFVLYSLALALIVELFLAYRTRRKVLDLTTREHSNGANTPSA